MMYSQEEVRTFEIKSGKAVFIGTRELKLKFQPYAQGAAKVRFRSI